MIVEIKAKNCFAFEDEIVFNLEADMSNKRFGFNVHKEKDFNILKTAGIYGSNNAGKTCLVSCIRELRNIMLNQKSNLKSNIFQISNQCELGVTFLYADRKFTYDVWYDTKTKEYPYEKFAEIIRDDCGNEQEVLWLLKDKVNNEFQYEDEELKKILPMVLKAIY